MKIIAVFFVFGLLLLASGSALHSENYIKELTTKIVQDCNGQNLQIKEGLISSNNGEITSLKPDEVNYSNIFQILNILDNVTYVTYASLPCYNAPGFMGSGGAAQGCGLLKCGQHRLDISGDSFYWDNIKYEGTRNEFNYAQANAPNSQAVAGSNAQAIQNNRNLTANFFWSEGTIGGLIIAGVIWVISRIILFEYKKRRTKQTSKKKGMK